MMGPNPLKSGQMAHGGNNIGNPWKLNRSWPALLMFIIGATSRYDLTLDVRIPLSEIIAFGAIPFVLYRVPVTQFSRIWPIVGILGLWALGILVSDVMNGFQAGLFIRGFAKPLWCLLWMLFFIGVLYKDFRALLLYPAGVVLASLQNYSFPQAWTVGRIRAGGYDAVAYGLSPILTAVTVFLAVALYRRGRLYAALFFGINMIVVGTLGGPRSSIAIMMLNSLIVIYIWWTRRSGGKVFRLSLKRVVLLSFLAVAAAAGIFEAYTFAAYEGWLGEMQRAKFIGQSDTVFGDSILGLIVDGRTAVFGAVLAIIDNPIVGYGSWRSFELTEYFYNAVAYVGTDARELNVIAASNEAFAPGHSVLFTAWMENGILAAIALILIGLLVLKEFLQVVQQDSRVAPLLIVLATSFFWAYFFSPFGSAQRLVIGLFLALFVTKFCESPPKLMPHRKYAPAPQR